MDIKDYILFFWFFLIIQVVAWSQNELFNEAPLKKVLFALEKKFDVKFSFYEYDITGELITADIENNTLDDILRKLELQTDLSFKKITKRYVVVQGKSFEVQVCGIVVDFLSQKPLFGTSITNSDGTKGTSSDEKGYFYLENYSENDSINISFLGYKTIALSAKSLQNLPCATIYLHQTSSILGEVIIQNYLNGGTVKKQDGSEELYPSELGILPGLTEPDLLRSIQLLPGVKSPNETASGLHIRGGYPRPKFNPVRWHKDV